MKRIERVKEMSEVQLAFFIWSLLLCKNTPIAGWRNVTDVVEWLCGDWIEDEYPLY